MWTFRSHQYLARAFALILVAFCCQFAMAQADDPANGETDPVKLFERGQDAHAKGDSKKALELYEAAIKLKPEFPEAEFQRAMVLLATNRQAEALEGFNRAVALRPDWAMAYARFGSELAFLGTFDNKAELILRRAIELDGRNLEAIVALAVLRQHAKDFVEAVKLIRDATSLPNATSQTWRRRAYIEHAAGDDTAAVASITRALEVEPRLDSMHFDRARFLLALNDRAGALADLDTFKPTSTTDAIITLDIAQLYARAGRPDQSLRLLDSLNEDNRKRPEVIALRADIAGDAGSSVEQRAALEQLLARDPQNAGLLDRLGNAYRRVDPAKSEGYYYRALQIDPKNAKYATGYAAALVQLRRFAEAENVLRRVLAAEPDNYPAHANLALSLYELKRFAEAVPEYEWLAGARPEIAATYFFLATAHDNLGEYQQALDAYESFLSRADPANNKLEIEKVNLRLPTLRAQIQRGQGTKRKNP
jgi:tetratricopeptide (TPR) repeat protein